MTPGAYPGLPMADYLRLPALSASVIRTLIDECPKAAHWASWLNPTPPPPDDTGESDKGTTAHSIVLENNDALMVEVNPVDFAGSKGGIPVGWTTNLIRARRDEIRAGGRIPMLTKDVAAVRGMVASAREFIASLEKTEPAIWAMFQPEGGDSELTCIWDDDGTLCRMRPDRISKDRQIIVDLKFTKRSADPDAQGRLALPDGKISAAWYRRGSRKVFGTAPAYVFMVTEMKPPYLPALPGVDPTGLAIGAEKVEWALREWQQCVAMNRFPGYPNRVVYPETAPWELSRWETKQLLSMEQRMELGSQG